MTQDGAEALKETLSTVLDVGAMIAIVVGVVGGLFPYLGWWSLSIGGVLLVLLSVIAGEARTEKPAPAVEPSAEIEPLPGPDHPGNIHVSGR